MAKIRKIRKTKSSKFNLNMLLGVLCLFMFGGFLITQTQINAENVSLSKKVAANQEIIRVDEERVATMALEVKQMEERERVMDMLEDEGLEVNQDNIVAIGDKE